MNKAADVFEPPIPPHHTSGPGLDIQEVLRSDSVPPPATLLEKSDYVVPVVPIPTARYTDPAYHEMEVDHMWSRVWQVAAWSFDMPEPGDSIVYRNVGQSAVLVRQKDGSIKAFENSCPHRGIELCADDANLHHIRCPYHAFTWSIEGDCRWLPTEWDFPQFDRRNFPLRQVRCEMWNGFVFVNFDDDAKPLDEYLGKMVDQWKDWDFESSRYRAVTAIVKCKTNWKSAMDAFLETMHVTATHPQAIQFAADTASQYDVWPDEPHFNRFHSMTGFVSDNSLEPMSAQEGFDVFTGMYLPEAFGKPDGELRPGETIREGIARLARMTYKERLNIETENVSEAELVDGTEYLVFPNFVIWPSWSNPIYYRFRPDTGPDDCIWEISFFVPFSGERPPSGPVIELPEDGRLADVPGFEYLGYLLDQDVANFPQIQKGMKANRSGVLHLARYSDQRIRHYHETLERYIQGTI